MTSSSAKVDDIFREAGTAFNKLSEMTMSLQAAEDSVSAEVWNPEDLETLRSSVHRFAVELNKISQHIKLRTISQIRTTLKRKAFEDAGIPMREVTLNMLNASEIDDVDGLSGGVKLEFDPDEDAAT
ncbi:chromatin complexes subunit BAP18-like isoform X4 [Spodoptera litura]|uniref:Chromatin complexes subunit BAP18-like isoform X4 n=1 Tax=Spodoptera litura TaxID=69820 RepID=A0A9J7J153_SPOLT|nr:chromatin complexes subunit BAP18-like isoform X4 [Spodoptera litura]